MTRRTLHARVGLLAVSTVVSVLAGEVAYRAYSRGSGHTADGDRPWRQRISRMNATIYRRSDDPRLIYEPRPASSVEMPYGAAGFNAAGMRDDREHTERGDGRARVAVVGDSVVWGEEIALADTLPRHIESASGGRAEVLNFGVSGYDTAQEALWYERAVRRWRPSVVVVVYCINDVMIMSGPFNRYATPDEARRKDEQDAFFDRVAPLRAETLEGLGQREEERATLRWVARARSAWRVERHQRSADYRDEYTVMYAQTERVARVAAGLRALGESIRADGAVGHLVVSPVLRDWSHYHWRAAHAAVAAAGRAAGFTVHDPIDEWRASTRPEALRLPGDALHYRGEGNRVLGAYVARAIGVAAR